MCQPPWQIGICQERAAIGDRVRSAVLQGLLATLPVIAAVGDIEAGPSLAQLREQGAEV